MFYWIEQNREWILSGVGVFVISSMIGFVSSLLTLYFKFRSDKKKRKFLSIKTKLNEYKIQNRSDSEKLKIFYQEKTYDNLCQYIVEIKNDGFVGIDGQDLLMALPRNCEVVRSIVNCSSQAIKWDEELLENIEKQEILYRFKRIERSDKIRISYLLNTDNVEQISIQPRGADGVCYTFQEDENIPSFEMLIIYMVLFVLFGAIPFIGNVAQAFILLISSSTIIDVLKDFQKKMKSDNMLTINTIDMDKSATIKIYQK
jgi:hypothetical protein